jgi:hypothetical protein
MKRIFVLSQGHKKRYPLWLLSNPRKIPLHPMFSLFFCRILFGAPFVSYHRAAKDVEMVDTQFLSDEQLTAHKIVRGANIPIHVLKSLDREYTKKFACITNTASLTCIPAAQ